MGSLLESTKSMIQGQATGTTVACRQQPVAPVGTVAAGAVPPLAATEDTAPAPAVDPELAEVLFLLSEGKEDGYLLRMAGVLPEVFHCLTKLWPPARDNRLPVWTPHRKIAESGGRYVGDVNAAVRGYVQCFCFQLGLVECAEEGGWTFAPGELREPDWPVIERELAELRVVRRMLAKKE